MDNNNDNDNNNNNNNMRNLTDLAMTLVMMMGQMLKRIEALEGRLAAYNVADAAAADAAASADLDAEAHTVSMNDGDVVLPVDDEPGHSSTDIDIE